MQWCIFWKNIYIVRACDCTASCPYQPTLYSILWSYGEGWKSCHPIRCEIIWSPNAVHMLYVSWERIYLWMKVFLSWQSDRDTSSAVYTFMSCSNRCSRRLQEVVDIVVEQALDRKQLFMVRRTRDFGDWAVVEPTEKSMICRSCRGRSCRHKSLVAKTSNAGQQFLFRM